MLCPGPFCTLPLAMVSPSVHDLQWETPTNIRRNKNTISYGPPTCMSRNQASAPCKEHCVYVHNHTLRTCIIAKIIKLDLMDNKHSLVSVQVHSKLSIVEGIFYDLTSKEGKSAKSFSLLSLSQTLLKL